MKTIYHCFIYTLCVFSPIFVRAQGVVAGPIFVCAGTSAGYQIIDNSCASFPYGASWSITGGSTAVPSTTATAITVDFNAPSTSAIRNGVVGATYLCPQTGGTVIQKTALSQNVRIFILDPPILTNSNPTQFDCGISQVMSFLQSNPYSSYLGSVHPSVTTTWSIPNCWNRTVNPNDRSRMNATTDAGGGFGTVSVRVTESSCNQSVTASKSFTRIIPPLDRTFSQNPIVSDTRPGLGFIRANGNTSIPNLSTVVFTAGSFIDLEPSFTSEYGSNFTAQIVQGPAPCVATLCSPSSFGKMGESQDESIEERDPIKKESTSISSMIKVFPNPFENNIQINYNQEEGSFELYDISGKVLTNGKLKSELNQIELTTLENGVYFIRVLDKQGVQLHVSKVYKLN
jgi:hypothetical protein